MKAACIPLLLCVSGASPAIAQDAPLPGTAGAASTTAKMPDSADCVVEKAVACKSDTGCSQAERLGELTIPLKFTVDFKNRVVMTARPDGFMSASPIGTLVGDDQESVVQGVENGIGWMLHGSTSDHSMTMAIASHSTVFTGYGRCDWDEDSE